MRTDEKVNLEKFSPGKLFKEIQDFIKEYECMVDENLDNKDDPFIYDEISRFKKCLDCIIDIFLNKDILMYKNENGISVIQREGVGENIVDKDGFIISDEWFDHVYPFYENYAVVTKDGKCNYIDTEGDLLLKKSAYFCDIFQNGYAIICKKEGKYNYIDKHGRFLSKRWFSQAERFSDDGTAYCWIGDGRYLIDKNGNLRRAYKSFWKVIFGL